MLYIFHICFLVVLSPTYMVMEDSSDNSWADVPEHAFWHACEEIRPLVLSALVFASSAIA